MLKTKRSVSPRGVGRPGSPPLMIPLDRRTRVPLQRQIYIAIRDAILGGPLAPGTRLPASRTLADDLGVSRTTVVLAYESLLTEGYITGRGSAGSFVAGLRPEQTKQQARARTARSSTPGARDASIDRRTSRAVTLARAASGMPNVRSEERRVGKAGRSG